MINEKVNNCRIIMGSYWMWQKTKVKVVHSYGGKILASTYDEGLKKELHIEIDEQKFRRDAVLLKSRDMAVEDTFHNLQLEWVCYFIRSKVYDPEWSVKMFTDICAGKKEKIDRFSLKNQVPSIFTKKERLQKYLDEFYPETNIPNFQYTPKNQGKLERWDKHYFYKPGTFIIFEDESVRVLRNDTLNDTVDFITKRRQLMNVPYCEVRRDILDLF